MSSRAAEFASAILIGVLVGVFAGAYLIVMPYSAADDCLSEPKGDAPQGQHWYYRIERGTKRHCWYLRSELEKSSRVASSERSSSAKSASRKQDGGTQRSVADARAELPSRSRIEDDTSAFATRPAVVAAIPNAAATAANVAVGDDNSASSNVMSRWPDPTGVSSSADPQPDAAATTVVAAAAPAAQPDPGADQPAVAAEPAPASVPAAPAPTAPATTVTPVEKYSGSLQELLIVAFAALALAGLIGSAVYRLSSVGRSRRRYDATRRSADWQQPRKKKTPRARPADPQPVSTRAERYARSPDVAAEPAEYAPEPSYAAPEHVEPNYAPEPSFAAQTGYEPQYEPQRAYEPVSEYAPKPRPKLQTRELEESFESIEQLLIRLAR
jgi:hypothetical protein